MFNDYKEKFPFITGMKYGDAEYAGIVVNYDNQIITFYDLAKMHSPEAMKEFLILGDTWWWESNRQLPIDVFMHTEMHPFSECLTTLALRDIEHLFGPMTTLQNMLKKRIKRKSIQLIKKV